MARLPRVTFNKLAQSPCWRIVRRIGLARRSRTSQTPPGHLLAGGIDLWDASSLGRLIEQTLAEDERWMTNKVGALYVKDAGTDSGVS